ncbi:unnamed protein product [Schistocephalus solidus]|uniref:G_PROTEIN_RECEP_F1_2 domain-containing protein n=1 Tax=Schistocephalus solidus TaxID=70667 RepID=A0A183T8I2_SCHSO|nr:unnamed protein product [Schistocephalus solidus]
MSESRTFWYCVESHQWPDVYDILLIVFAALGLLLNIAVAILLFLLRGPCKTSLALLRGLVVSCAMACLVNFIEHAMPKMERTSSYHFNRLICIFWASRFFYWIFVVIASQFLFFFAVYRFLDLTGNDDYKIPSEEYQIPTYSTLIPVFSVIISAPQTFSVNLVGDVCNCSHRKINIPLLSLIYAQVYIWTAILIVFDGSVLTFISFQLWRLMKMPKNLRGEDKLELLHFYKTTFTEGPLCENTAASNSSKVAGSLCIIPLTISYLVLFSYDQLYQFASAINLTAYVIGTQVQKFGGLLLVWHCVIVPIIVLIYVRPLRLCLQKFWRKLTGKT